MISPLRELNSYDLQLNQIARTYKSVKSRQGQLNLPTLNRMIDRVHDARITERVQSPSLEYSIPHELTLHASEEDSRMGPGYYGKLTLVLHEFKSFTASWSFVDAERYSRYFDASKQHTRFGLSKTQRNSFLMTLPYDDSSDLDADRLALRRSSNSGVGFTKAPRWSRGMYRREKHLSTSTIGLGPDWDKPFLTLHEHCFSKCPKNEKPVIEYKTHALDIDAGPKMSLATSVLKSRKTLASAFKSKTPIGMQIRPATSGTIGPGSFPGAELSAMEIKYPLCRSASFLR